MDSQTKKIISKIILAAYSVLGSFIISVGWLWYHFPQKPFGRFVSVCVIAWLVILLVWLVVKKIFKFIVIKYERHEFWQNTFLAQANQLFFITSLLFLVFFSYWEIISLVYFFLVLLLLFWRFDRIIAGHPATQSWRLVSRAFFIMAVFVFITSAVFQYISYNYYILDSNLKYYNIVLFRSWAMTMFWLCGFAVASVVYSVVRGGVRRLFFILWATVFIFALLIGAANVGVLYHSGIYLNPIVLEHAGGSGLTVFIKTEIVLVIFLIIFGGVFITLLKKFVRSHALVERRYWLFFDVAIIALAIFSFLTVASLKSTPEAMVLRSFYQYISGSYRQVELAPVVQEKLKKFGLTYDKNQFYVAMKDKVYQKEKDLLPAKFNNKKPNIVIIFFESLSSRLTEVYNPRLSGLTPGLLSMSRDPHTTIFKNTYNPSTPTVTGLIGDLCSFLPPTGHTEIAQDKHLRHLYLLCLPEVLKESGYKDSLYMTAVEKDFANKDTIFGSMGVDSVWGTAELSKKISGAPLSWGYSDHQMLPLFFNEMNSRKANNAEPFLMMLSTVDTHPPFDLAKDMVNYADGKNNLLNSIHTSDDAFRIFWDKFMGSDLKDNTIVIAIADHAVFPTAYTADYFPNEVGKMNFYDELTYMMYVPDSVLPKNVDLYSSSMDLTPTILQMLKINLPNTFEGHSVFDDRDQYPNLLGMHEFGLYINQLTDGGTRTTDYAPPSDLNCAGEAYTDVKEPLTLCEYYNYYQWKRRMFEEGRLWLAPAKK